MFHQRLAKGGVILVSGVSFSVFNYDEDVVSGIALTLTGMSAIKT
jgi:hypothetical protein